ncbi:MAG: stalk domain-containing protein [Dehalobacterium sp.]
MKKKNGLSVLFIFITFFMFVLPVFGSESSYSVQIPVTYRGIQVYLDGQIIGGEEPFILNQKGIVMVPVRTIAEATGRAVLWDDIENSVRISNSVNYNNNQKSAAGSIVSLGAVKQEIGVTYKNIQIYAGSRKITVEEPFILNSKGIVMVPLRGMIEATGLPVTWDGNQNRIYIGTIPEGVNIKESTSSSNRERGNLQEKKVDIQDMMVIRNVGPFFVQNNPFIIVADKYYKGLGVRLSSGSTAEIVLKTNREYKAIEGWLGIDDETKNTSGAYFLSIYTDSHEVLSNVITEGGAEKIIKRTPDKDYNFDYKLVDMDVKDKDNKDRLGLYETQYLVNSYLFEKEPRFLGGPIYPASYPKYISPVVTDISDALTVTIRVTWTDGSEGDYEELTAVLADFKFIKK